MASMIFILVAKNASTTEFKIVKKIEETRKIFNENG
jgi:hypothetical protein